jgi:hypothetical protein
LIHAKDVALIVKATVTEDSQPWDIDTGIKTTPPIILHGTATKVQVDDFAKLKAQVVNKFK